MELLDMMLMSGRLGKFVTEIIDTIEEEKTEKQLWEFWLHKDFERSWKEFKDSLTQNDHNANAAPTQEEIKETVIASAKMLANFCPHRGGEQGGSVQTGGNDSG